MKKLLSVKLCIVLILSPVSALYAGGGINSGKPVPYLGENETSAEFLWEMIKKMGADDKDTFMPYSRNLAKTLSQLSPAEQSVVWYGS